MRSRWRKAFVSFLFLILLLVPLAALGDAPTEGSADSRTFDGGDGSREDPYQISNVDQLQSMGLDLDAHYVLINDVDASATRDWNDGKGFSPVGPSRSDGFAGLLDGRDHAISDLYIDIYANNVGMIGWLDRGRIKNVRLEDMYVRGEEYVGGLVGHVEEGVVDDCIVTGTVSGNGKVGGLVGWSEDGIIIDNHAEGYVYGGDNNGGLVGFNSYGNVEDCSAAARVTGSEQNNGDQLQWGRQAQSLIQRG